MKKHYAKQLEETTYETRLANGLTVYLHPKPGFSKTYAVFNTNFGSVDQTFIPLGAEKAVTSPSGVAHFLEHKLFEKEHGDVFNDFSKLGASANAFTSFENTAYLFETTDQVVPALELLLDFVQEPYFTDATVEKEKGIIAQEILMYDDAPMWRLQRRLLECLYPAHPVREDIAGTVASIDKITPEILYENYRTFYHPSNMQLFVVGPFDVEELLAVIESNQAQKTFASGEELRVQFPEEDLADLVPKAEETMDVTRSKVLVGLRGETQKLVGLERLTQHFAMQFGLQMLFGPTSDTYLDLYDDGLIDDSFTAFYSGAKTFNFLAVGGDSRHAEELAERVVTVLATSGESHDLTDEHLSLVKKQAIGQIIQSMNSPEYIAHQFLAGKVDDYTIFDQVELMQGITLDQVKEHLTAYYSPERLSQVFIHPQSKES